MPPPISYSVVRTGSPSSSMAALAVVPPMSKEMTLVRPVTRARWAQAITPAAGPDSTRYAGRRCAAAGLIVPPADCMISSGAVMPLSASLPVSERR